MQEISGIFELENSLTHFRIYKDDVGCWQWQQWGTTVENCGLTVDLVIAMKIALENDVEEVL